MAHSCAGNPPKQNKKEKTGMYSIDICGVSTRATKCGAILWEDETNKDLEEAGWQGCCFYLVSHITKTSFGT